MSTPQDQAQQQQQDPTPLIRALQAQRNFAQDQLADAQANFALVQGHAQALSEANAQLQSQVDELTMQLESTKAALGRLQEVKADAVA
jgi:chromosome segregation ATPase